MTKHPEFNPVINDLEAVSGFLDHVVFEEAATHDKVTDFQDWQDYHNRLGYLVDRLREHVADLRRLVDDREQEELKDQAGRGRRPVMTSTS
jgi:hypothetical protein